MKRVITTLSLSIYVSTLLSQFIIRSSLNLPRGGDRIERQEIVCGDVSAIGEDVYWDFSGSRPFDNKQSSEFFSLGDSCQTLYRVDESTQETYAVNKDTLFMTCFESNLWKMSFLNPVAKIAYPMSFGDSLSSPVHIRYVNCGNAVQYLTGIYTVKADAWGTLILPDCDTLRQVLRICSILRTAHWEGRNYQWYAAGYRYPIIESQYYEQEGKSPFWQSYCCPPEAQIILDDELNEQIRDTLLMSQRMNMEGVSSVRLYLTKERNLKIVHSGLVTNRTGIYSQGGTAVRQTKKDKQ